MEKGPDEAVSPSTELTGRQRTLWETLRERDEGLASMYLGALITLSDATNPERLSQAAHSLREVMDKLPRYYSLPVPQSHSPLMSKVRALEEEWKRLVGTASNHSSSGSVGDIDDPPARFLRSCGNFFTWFAEEFPRHRKMVGSMLSQSDPRRITMPETLQTRVVEDWDELRNFFLSVLHHDSVPNEVEFQERLAGLEFFLLDRLQPKTFADFDELDRIMEEGESHA